jgi:hypothetical protein
MGVTMGIENLSEVNKFFDSILLTEKEGNSLKLGSLKASFSPMIREARKNLTTRTVAKTGNLRKSLGTIGKARKSGVYAAAGARYKGRHFHIINSGTKARLTRMGVSRGAVRKFAFFDDAFHKHVGQLPTHLQIQFNKRMERFMKNKY